MDNKPQSARQEIPALVTFGVGGHAVYFKPVKTEHGVTNSRLSGYSSPENFFAPIPGKGPDHDPSQYQGVPVVDLREIAQSPEGRMLLFRSPMVDPGLGDGQIEKCPQPSEAMAVGMAGSSYGAILAVNEAQRAAGEKRGALDMISVEEYVRMWRGRGARVGVIEGEGFKWELRPQDQPMPKVEQQDLGLDVLDPIPPEQRVEPGLRP